MPIRWNCLPHTELDVATLYELLALRTQVFVVEQQCAYQELDGQDLAGDTLHLMARDGDHQLLAYARLLDPQRQGGDAVIGRVLIAPSARGLGLGHTLVERALEQCQLRWPDAPVVLSAQAHLTEFYARHGFEAVTPPYDEDGIAHVGMRHR